MGPCPIDTDTQTASSGEEVQGKFLQPPYRLAQNRVLPLQHRVLGSEVLIRGLLRRGHEHNVQTRGGAGRDARLWPGPAGGAGGFASFFRTSR